MLATLKIPLYPTTEQIYLFNKLSDVYSVLQNLAVDYIKVLKIIFANQI